MILTKTPFRVSLFGGGTDYPEYFEQPGAQGAVLGMAIDKYCYVGVKHMPPGQEIAPGVPLHYRVQYSKVDDCNFAEEVKHPAVRAALLHYKLQDQQLEFHCFGDLPGRSGLGGSSSFTVGLLLALSSLMPHKVNREHVLVKSELARSAIFLEREVIGEAVGWQDQLFAAMGGANVFEFNKCGYIQAPLELSAAREQDLQSSLFLVFTGGMRDAHVMAAKQIQNFSRSQNALQHLYGLVQEGRDLLLSNRNLDQLGSLLHSAWMAKRSLCPDLTNASIDSTYAAGLVAGATGGKLLGAGGGGFMLFYVPMHRQMDFIKAMKPIRFKIDRRGAQVIIDERA
jgi:D-glycero-alpha-D-manno-heptose-7-phosphate kinase